MRAMNFDNPDWRPLERLIGSRCAEFMWMWREGGVQFYKHINTRRYLHLDKTGRCYRQGPTGLEPGNLDEELKRVFA
ncbi:MAG: hypothetical protein ACRD06_06605 [Terriglobia bacterium]